MTPLPHFYNKGDNMAVRPIVTNKAPITRALIKFLDLPATYLFRIASFAFILLLLYATLDKR